MPDKHFGRHAGKVTIKGGRASRSQREILGRALAYADKVKAPYAAKKALVEALIVESEAKNLSTPSADGFGSYGVLQGLERYHSRRDLMNPEYQFGVFLGRNKKYPKGFTGKGNAVDLARRGMRSGDIAQAVEGSAYPERYGQVAKEAARIIRLYRQGQKGSAPSLPTTGGKSTGGTGGASVPTASSSGEPNYMALINYAKNRNKGASVADLASALVSDTTDTSVDTTPTPKQPKVPKVSGGGSGGSGSPKGSKLKELFYTPVGQWKGSTPISPVPDHNDHVHVAAGVKTVVKLGKTAQKMGLRVGENKSFSGSTPTGGHAPNSWHYRDRAIDVSGDPKKMAAFTRYLKRKYGLK